MVASSRVNHAAEGLHRDQTPRRNQNDSSWLDVSEYQGARVVHGDRKLTARYGNSADRSSKSATLIVITPDHTHTKSVSFSLKRGVGTTLKRNLNSSVMRFLSL
jgi:hypothetical protein